MTIPRGAAASDLEALESITEVALSGADLDGLLHRLIRRMVEVSGAEAGVEREAATQRATQPGGIVGSCGDDSSSDFTLPGDMQIAAGGGKMGTKSGDAYVAFALPD